MKMAVRGTLALAATFFLAGAPARADKPSPQGPAPTAPGQPAGVPEAPKTQIEQDIETYWGKRRKVAVIQKRIFDEKVNRWEFSLHFGYIPNDPFMNYLPVGTRVTYHFKEWLGAEFGFLYTDATSFKSSLADGITSIGQGTPFTLQLKLLEKLKMTFDLAAVFSLIHGKVAVMKTGLSHFDLFLTAGPSFHLVDPSGDASSFRPGGMLGAGFKFFINEFFGIRLDVRQYLFPKGGDAGGGLHKPTEISLGATFFAG